MVDPWIKRLLRGGLCHEWGGGGGGGRNFGVTDDTTALQPRVGGGYVRPHIIYIFFGWPGMYGYIIHVEGEGGQTSINCLLKGLDITLEPVTTYLYTLHLTQ